MNTIATSIDGIENLPPGPSGLPLVGSAPQFLISDTIDFYTEQQGRYGDIVHLKFGSRPVVLLSSPEFAHHVLVKNQKNYVKGIGLDGIRMLVGQGLLASEGALWQKQRRLLQPSFTPAAMNRFIDGMTGVIKCVLDGWAKKAAAGQSLVLDDETTLFAIRVMGLAMFGLDLSDNLLDVANAFQTAFQYAAERSVEVVRTPLAIPTARNRRFQADMECIEKFVAERIAEAKVNPREDNLLSLMVHSRDADTGQGMSEQQLRDEVVTLLFAGFETTARSLTWSWSLLHRHPDVVKKMTEEADTVLTNGIPTWNDLHRLRYTRMVADEVLRLYPAAPVTARQSVDADTIGGYHIPAGTIMIVFIYQVHRHAASWPEPQRFDPERFAPGAAESRPKSAYMPFGSGPRICLGNNFALLEMVTGLSMMCRRFEVEVTTSGDVGHSYFGTLRPNRPLEIRLRERNTV